MTGTLEESNTEASYRERRRSRRIPKALPMVVGGNMPCGKFFRDHAVTEVVSAHGAKLIMKPLVECGSIVELSHRLKSEFTLARVVSVGHDVIDGVVPVAVELVRPERQFWAV